MTVLEVMAVIGAGLGIGNIAASAAEGDGGYRVGLLFGSIIYGLFLSTGLFDGQTFCFNGFSILEDIKPATIVQNKNKAVSPPVKPAKNFYVLFNFSLCTDI